MTERSGHNLRRPHGRRMPALLAGLLAALAVSSPGAGGHEAVHREPRPAHRSSLIYTDPRVGRSLPVRSWDVFFPRDPRRPLGPARDPKFNILYPYRRYVRCRTSQGDTDDASIRFVVHYARPNDLPLAGQVGDLLAQLYWVGADYLGRGPSERAPVDVWLARGGEAGGEEFQGDIYLLDIDTPRAPAEWVREIAHEYSHLTLPAIGEFRSPEKWANGYLGERLYLKWLLLDNSRTELWNTYIDAGGYAARQLYPLRDAFLNDGPEAPAARRTDWTGMQHLIGKVLALEEAYGPALLRAAFDRFAACDPQAFGVHLSGAVQQLQPAEVEVPVSQSQAGRRAAGYWTFLPAGRWRLEAEGALPARLGASLEGAALKPVAPGAWETDLPGAGALWRRLRLAAPAGEVMELRRVVFRRTGL